MELLITLLLQVIGIDYKFMTLQAVVLILIGINTYSSVTARDIQIWGGQLEEQTQAETYAPTTGLPVTIDLFTENNYGTMTNMSASDIIEDTPNN